MSEILESHPKVFIHEDVDPSISINVQPVLQTLQECGTSQEGINNTSIVIDAKNRLSYRGSQTPKALDRILHGKSEMNEGNGSVIRLGTKLRGKNLTPDEINHTLDHELQHVAQTDRSDKRILIGNLAIWGGLVGGAIAANALLGKKGNRITRVAVTLAGGLLGNRLGYQVAPHERRARSAASIHSTPAVSKK